MSGSNPPSAAAIARLAVSQNNLKRSVQAAFDGERVCRLFPPFSNVFFGVISKRFWVLFKNHGSDLGPIFEQT